MARIEIRGVIVPSNWDLSWTKEYVDKGIISPESAIRRGISAADKSKPLEMYINSPGGSVFAAYEVINALAAWKAETKQPVNITVGAMAASAASAIAILSGANLDVHRNSKLMFHGAWTETVGGSEAHQDTATLLDQINGDIKTQLVSKYGIEPEVVDTWFAEGRQGWITAQDAVKYGIAGSVVDADDEEIEFMQADIAGLKDYGTAIAAMVTVKQEETNEGESDEGGESNGASEQNESGDDADSSDDAATSDEGNGSDAEDSNESIIAARVEILLGERLEAHVAELNQLKAHAESQAKLIASLQSEKDKAIDARAKDKKQFEQLLAESQEALKQANARMTKLTLGSLSFSASIESWPEALKACDGDYAKARKQYPDAYQSYMNHNNRK